MIEGSVRKAIIQPTGNEIAEGIVLDTDSPMIRDVLRTLGTDFEVLVNAPVADDEDLIEGLILKSADEQAWLVVLIGGSGGGHRFSKTLAKDFTHSAMDHVLTEKCGTSLYGKNGHLWSRLLCGYAGQTLVFNVPGPYQEAAAAIQAFAEVWRMGKQEPASINQAMAEAVRQQYMIREKRKEPL